MNDTCGERWSKWLDAYVNVCKFADWLQNFANKGKKVSKFFKKD